MTRTTNPCERWRLPICLCHLLALTSRVRSITVQIQSDRRALPNNFPASGYSQEAIGFLRAGDGGRSSENRFTISRTDKTGIHLSPRLKSNWDSD
jgi:hypothetical protein